MMRLFVFIILSLPACVSAQDLSLYSKEWYADSAGTLPYRLLRPPANSAQAAFPLLIFLHGAFEKGEDNEKQLGVGARFFLRDSIRNRYPAFVVFPQCPENDAWAYFENKPDFSTGSYTGWVFPFRKDANAVTRTLLRLVDKLLVNDSVDRSRVYIAGISQGAMGVLDIIARRPELFAGALSACGAGEPSTSGLFAGKTALWLFHGDKDNVVPIDFTRRFYRRLKRAGSIVRYNEYEGVTHDSWGKMFAEPELMQWLFAQHKMQ